MGLIMITQGRGQRNNITANSRGHSRTIQGQHNIPQSGAIQYMEREPGPREHSLGIQYRGTAAYCIGAQYLEREPEATDH
jgi:hypothetical protein